MNMNQGMEKESSANKPGPKKTRKLLVQERCATLLLLKSALQKTLAETKIVFHKQVREYVEGENKARGLEPILPIRGVGEKAFTDVFNKFAHDYLEVVDVICQHWKNNVDATNPADRNTRHNPSKHLFASKSESPTRKKSPDGMKHQPKVPAKRLPKSPTVIVNSV